MSRSVTTPHGEEWTVRRAWVRVVFRRPWVVEAHRTDVADDDTSFDARWSVVGWRESGERVEQVAQHLEAGLGLPTTNT